METATANNTQWAIDPAHSEVHFKIKHLMISTVTGTIQNFEGTVETSNDDFSQANISFSADANSITTGDANRDGHLTSGDFFETENHPKITFQSTQFEKNANGHFTLTGDLNIKGISKSITLDVEHAGTATDPWGNLKAGFTLTGTVNRRDWGLNWNAALEAGGFLLADDVRILCEIQLAKKN